MPASPITITGANPNLSTNDKTQLQPFTDLTIADSSAYQTLTVKISMSTVEGAFANLGNGASNASQGTYLISGTASDVNQALHSLVYNPTPQSLAPGSTHTNTLTITATDGTNSASDAATQIQTLTTNTAPYLYVQRVAGTISDNSGTVPLLNYVYVYDPDVNATETATLTLSSTLHGTLSGLGTGAYDAATGVYSVSGTTSAVTDALYALRFTPALHQVTPGQTVTTTFSISLTDGLGASVATYPNIYTGLNTDPVTASVSVSALASNTVPSVGSVPVSFATDDSTPINPYAGTTLSDPDVGQTYSVTITGIVNGALSNLAGGTYDAAAGTYTKAGSVADLQTAIQGLVFTPTYDQVTLGNSIVTQLSLVVSDNASSATPRNTRLTTTSVDHAPTIAGLQSGQATTDAVTHKPFVAVVITDPDVGQTETATVTFDRATGALSNLGAGSLNAAGDTYTVSGSYGDVQAALRAVVFTPTANLVSVGAASSTSFALAVSDGTRTSTDNTASVVATSVNDAPALGGLPSVQAVNDTDTINPFASLTISDPDVGQTESATVQLTDAGQGVLSNPGIGTLAGDARGYTVSGSAADVQAALRGLVFTPTANQVAPGATTNTAVSLDVSDGVTITYAASDVVATSINDAVVVSGATAPMPLAMTDNASVSPFPGVSVSDADPGQVETATVSLDTAANGSLASSAGGTYNASTGVFTVSGTTASITAALTALVFTPTANQVAPGQSVNTILALQASDGIATTPAQSVMVTATSINDLPTLQNAPSASQAVTDITSIAPFSTTRFVDPDVGQTETLNVSLSAPSAGTLSSTSGGTFDPATGIFTVTGTTAAVTAALQALTFTPTYAQSPIGTVTPVTLTVTGGDGIAALGPVTAQIESTSVDHPPVLGNLLANQTVDDHATVNPFSQLTLTEVDTGQTETAHVSIDPTKGTLSDTAGGTVVSSTGLYTVRGSADQVQTDLRALLFTPTANQVTPGNSTAANFALQVSDGANVVDATTNVTIISVNDAPVIAGAAAAQPTTDKSTVTPFSTIVVTDVDPGQTETATVSFAGANGTLSNLSGGSLDLQGAFSITGTTTQVQAALRDLVFMPTANQTTPRQSITTGFTVSVSDGIATTTDTATSVVTMSVNDAPTIGGTTAGQRVSDVGTLRPLSTISIADVDPSQQQTASVTFNQANGTLSNLAAGTLAANGTYTVIGSTETVQAALRGLIFTPTAHQVAPGQQVATGLQISLSDGIATTTDRTTQILAIAANDAPVISGSLTSGTTDSRPSSPLAGMTVIDPNPGQTETAVLTLGSLVNGSVTNVGTGHYDAARGVYTVSGTLDRVNQALHGLVFNPVYDQVPLGDVVQSPFTLTVSDGLSTTTGRGTILVASTDHAPTIQGNATTVAATDAAPALPLAGITINDVDAGQIETATVRLSSATNGSLSNLGSGAYNAAQGVYIISGSVAAVQTALRGLQFITPANQIATGATLTTSFAVSLSDGTLTVSSSDTAVNVTHAPPLTAVVTRDTGALDNDGITKDDSLTGVAQAGASVVIHEGETTLGSVTALADNHWQIAGNQLGLGDGIHDLTVTSTDSAGNLSSALIHFVLDTIAPIPPSQDASLISNTPTPILSGSTEAGATVAVQLNGQVVGQTLSDAQTGAWTFQFASPLGVGTYNVATQATDVAGNVSTLSPPSQLQVLAPPLEGTTTVAYNALTYTQISQASKLELVPGTESVQLADGTLSVGQDTQQAYVARLYQGVLGRAEDTPGITFWNEALNEGASKVDIAHGFLSSDAGQAATATLSDQQFVASLYQGMLHRVGGSDEQALWTGQIASGLSRDQVLAQIADSPEAKQALSDATSRVWVPDVDAQRVVFNYETAFDRAPEASGLQYWTSALKSGLSVADMETAFAGSQEFQAAHGLQSSADLTTSLYQNGLGRAPSAVELAQVANSGQSTASLLGMVAQSPEAYSHLISKL